MMAETVESSEIFNSGDNLTHVIDENGQHYTIVTPSGGPDGECQQYVLEGVVLEQGAVEGTEYVVEEVVLDETHVLANDEQQDSKTMTVLQQIEQLQGAMNNNPLPEPQNDLRTVDDIEQELMHINSELLRSATLKDIRPSLLHSGGELIVQAADSMQYNFIPPNPQCPAMNTSDSHPKEANDYSSQFQDLSPLYAEPNKSDPSQIKRPMNAFMVWAKEYRTQLANRVPDVTNSRISVLLGEMWNSMTEDQKQPYYAEAHRLKTEHRMKYPDWVFRPSKRQRRYTPSPTNKMWPHQDGKYLTSRSSAASSDSCSGSLCSTRQYGCPPNACSQSPSGYMKCSCSVKKSPENYKPFPQCCNNADEKAICCGQSSSSGSYKRRSSFDSNLPKTSPQCNNYQECFPPLSKRNNTQSDSNLNPQKLSGTCTSMCRTPDMYKLPQMSKPSPCNAPPCMLAGCKCKSGPPPTKDCRTMPLQYALMSSSPGSSCPNSGCMPHPSSTRGRPPCKSKRTLPGQCQTADQIKCDCNTPKMNCGQSPRKDLPKCHEMSPRATTKSLPPNKSNNNNRCKTPPPSSTQGPKQHTVGTQSRSSSSGKKPTSANVCSHNSCPKSRTSKFTPDGHYINELPASSIHTSHGGSRDDWPFPFSPYPYHAHQREQAEIANRRGLPFYNPSAISPTNIDDLRLYGHSMYKDPSLMEVPDHFPANRHYSHWDPLPLNAPQLNVASWCNYMNDNTPPGSSGPSPGSSGPLPGSSCPPPGSSGPPSGSSGPPPGSSGPPPCQPLDQHYPGFRAFHDAPKTLDLPSPLLNRSSTQSSSASTVSSNKETELRNDASSRSDSISCSVASAGTAQDNTKDVKTSNQTGHLPHLSDDSYLKDAGSPQYMPLQQSLPPNNAPYLQS